MAAVKICSDFGAQGNQVCHCFHCFLIYLPWSDGTVYHDFNFCMLSFKPAFSRSSFMFIERLFSSSLSAVRVVSSAYLRLLIFLPAILSPACASCSPTFLNMHSASKLNKQGDNIQPWCTPLPIGTSLYCSVGQNVHLSFSVRSYEKSKRTIWPI